MKIIYLVLLSVTFTFCQAQNTKTVTIDPKKATEVKAKLEKAYPPAPKPAPVKDQKTATTAAAKTENKDVKSVASKINPNAKPFTFLGSFIMNFDDKNALGKSNTGKIKYALDGFQAAIIPTFANMKDVASMRSVLNTKENEITMLTVDVKGKKNGLLMQIPKPVIKITDPKKPVKAPVIKRTGETKVIQGFKCEKLIVTIGDSIKIESWVSIEINLNMSEILRMTNAGFKGKSPFGNTNMNDIKGTALETTITNKNGSVMKITLTEIKKIKPEASLFSMDGFKITDVRGLPMFGGQ